MEGGKAAGMHRVPRAGTQAKKTRQCRKAGRIDEDEKKGRGREVSQKPHHMKAEIRDQTLSEKTRYPRRKNKIERSIFFLRSSTAESSRNLARFIYRNKMGKQFESAKITKATTRKWPVTR